MAAWDQGGKSQNLMSENFPCPCLNVSYFHLPNYFCFLNFTLNDYKMMINYSQTEFQTYSNLDISIKSKHQILSNLLKKCLKFKPVQQKMSQRNVQIYDKYNVEYLKINVCLTIPQSKPSKKSQKLALSKHRPPFNKLSRTFKLWRYQFLR